MIGRIYAIYHDGEIVVVGSTECTINKRWREYKSKVRNPEYKSNIHTTMRKHGINNYKMELLEEVEGVTENELKAIEGMWQEMFKDLGIKLYNERTARGEKHGSPEYRARQRESQRERNRERRANPEYVARENERQSQPIQCELCGRAVRRDGIRRHQSSNYCLENRPKTTAIIRLKQ